MANNPRKRSMSTERHRNASTNDVSSSRSTSRPRQMRSNSKLNSGAPGPDEEYPILDITVNPRNERIVNQMEKARESMESQTYVEAVQIYTKVLHEEGNNLDAMYNRAVCLMHMGDHRYAVPDLLAVERENPFYDRQLYIGLAMCFASANDFVTAIRWLSKGLIKFPKFVEGFVTRAKLYIQQSNWDKAIGDCYKAITLSPADPTGFNGLGDALKGIGDIKSAGQAYTKAINLNDSTGLALQKRSRLYFEIERYDKAVKDVEGYIVLQPFDASAYYLKGEILRKMGGENDAILSFEQAIKYDDETVNLTTNALYNIGCIKIEQKDFYGAMFTFDRVTDSKSFTKDQNALKQYSESVLAMMKRKYKEGIQILTSLIRSRVSSIRQYLGNCYAYRGFGHAALENHAKAVKDFTTAGKYMQLDQSTIYNRLISSGVLATQKDNYKKAMSQFSKARKIFDRAVEPLFYTALLLVIQNKSKPDKTDIYKEAKSHLDEAIRIKDSESELYYFRGLLHMYLENPVDAIPDLDSAIDKAEDNLTRHFLARGICYALLKLYKEALQEFSIAIQIDENCLDAYFYRGCAAYTLDDTELALVDFQKLISDKPEDPLSHIHCGNLLMLTGAYEDAAKAFINANEKSFSAEATYQKAKCNVLIGDVATALGDLNRMLENEDTEGVRFDRDTLEVHKQRAKLELISDAIQRKGVLEVIEQKLTELIASGKRGEIFIPINLKTYRGVVYLYQNRFTKAQEDLMPDLGHPSIESSFNSQKSVPDTEEFYNSEMLYNLTLCLLLQEKYEESCEILEELVARCDRRDRGLFKFMAGLVLITLGKERDGEQLIDDSGRYEKTIVAQWKGNKTVTIAPYESQMPPFDLNMCGRNVRFRPVFNLPRIYPPSLSIKLDDELLKEFHIKACACKPEAPWLNRVKGMVQFTEEMQEIDAETIMDDDDPPPRRAGQETEESSDDQNERQCKSAVELRGVFNSSNESLEYRKQQCQNK